MKISIEYTESKETEVLIRGGATNPEILQIVNALHALNAKTTNENQIIGTHNEATYILDLDTILFFESEGEIVSAVTSENRYRVKQRLYEINELVGETKFIQISKWCIANIKKIEKVELGINATMTVFFKDTNYRQVLTRSYMKHFKTKVLGG